MSGSVFILGYLLGFRENHLVSVVIEKNTIFLNEVNFETDNLPLFPFEEVEDFFFLCLLDLLDDNLTGSLRRDTTESFRILENFITHVDLDGISDRESFRIVSELCESHLGIWIFYRFHDSFFHRDFDGTRLEVEMDIHLTVFISEVFSVCSFNGGFDNLHETFAWYFFLCRNLIYGSFYFSYIYHNRYGWG
ncbi:MAG: hypothetical protein ACD_78C00440G0003 [uncultured bacterium (gcode 4)]|uniref:Uncharacterized protein n=1 Tax=uncultured bacterium (gcode 4) TaxID=1234023 RepID=K1XVR7_9BACT|nr:MAG: hypothetical protein ACD_78C00440G0003 [uncultured bacterium (gcode 4)]